ncbi:unnamed protein product [Paramecium pentaurelia]|uniref:Pectin acetylesterase n=1 Tax=Paramecium pentaurelia TaxID=43138 RepID=A0A8S1XNB9_9CILI|nr:unnamed protein product [Paramecium pentaurelia]
MKFTLIILCLIIGSFSQDLYFVSDPEALCLDGSRGSYYFAEGYGSGSQNFIFHFTGGSWIQGLNEQQLLNSAYKSSKYNEPKITYNGFFSRSQSLNPDFYNWNIININYCDGTGHQGYKKDAALYNGKKLYFRGDKIVKSIIIEFYERMSKGGTVIVSGCSAGGLAAYYWVEYFRDILPLNVQVLGVPDSGIFIDMKSIDGTELPKLSLIEMQKLVNQEASNPNAECVQSNPNELWKCFYAQYLLRYVNVPIFIVNSLYDTASIKDLLQISCVARNSLSGCSQKERKYIEELHSSIQTVISGRRSIFRDTGSFAPACLEHCFLQTTYYQSTSWQVPGKSGFTIQKSLRQWLSQFNVGNLDNHIDSVDWPSNEACSNA